MTDCLTCRHHYTRSGNDYCDNQEISRNARDRCNEIIYTEFCRCEPAGGV